jgi:hypothetical protein
MPLVFAQRSFLYYFEDPTKNSCWKSSLAFLRMKIGKRAQAISKMKESSLFQPKIKLRRKSDRPHFNST